MRTKIPSTTRFTLASFGDEDDILNVTHAVREQGYKIVDVHAPYAVHGLDTAMGLRASKLPWVCFALAVVGALGKTWFEYWTTWLDWPINVGGKPFDSLPAFLPVTFEVMVLFAGLSTVAALFIHQRLYPGRKAVVPTDRVTNDQFVLVIEETDASFDYQELCTLLNQHHAVSIEERVEGTTT